VLKGAGISDTFFGRRSQFAGASVERGMQVRAYNMWMSDLRTARDKDYPLRLTLFDHLNL
jgi:hypothetical protein